MEQNFDERLLINQHIDPSFDEPVVHQILRIAIYDEFHAYELYSKVIEKFGPIAPFSHIIEAENRHYNLLLPLLEKYAVPIPNNDWYQKIDTPKTLIECCEIGVAAEIDNIAMYERLLQFTQEADIRDTLYRLQAASYNHHLPAFRQCVAQHYSNQLGQNNSSPLAEQIPNEPGNGYNGQANPDEIFAKAEEYQSLFQSIMSGNVDQQELSKLIQNSNLALIGGLLAGGLGTMMFNQYKQNTAQSESEETDSP